MRQCHAGAITIGAAVSANRLTPVRPAEPDQRSRVTAAERRSRRAVLIGHRHVPHRPPGLRLSSLASSG